MCSTRTSSLYHLSLVNMKKEKFVPIKILSICMTEMLQKFSDVYYATIAIYPTQMNCCNIC